MLRRASDRRRAGMTVSSESVIESEDTCSTVSLTSCKSLDNVYSMSKNGMAGDGPAIEARGLVKVYGETGHWTGST